MASLLDVIPRSDQRRVRMTESQFLQLEEPRAEWSPAHGGEAIFMSPVSIPHARVVGWLYRFAAQLAEATNAGEVLLDGVAHRLPSGDYLVPDLSFVKKDRLHVIQPTHLTGPADLVIEVVSADSRNRDYREKFAAYQSAGVPEYWIVDPTYHTIDAFQLVTGTYTPIQPLNNLLHSQSLPGFNLNPTWLSQTPLPKLPAF